MQVVKVLGAARHGPVDVPTESVVIDTAHEVSRELDRPDTADTQEQGVVDGTRVKDLVYIRGGRLPAFVVTGDAETADARPQITFSSWYI